MITIIITTYKRNSSIVSRAIRSALNQTYRDIEIIVVDDSPTDYLLREDVKSVVLECNKENNDIDVRYFPHDRNRGACAARNTGIYHARGEYIAFLDDDDEWLPEKLEKQIKVMKKTNASLVYCGYIYKNDVKKTSSIKNIEYHKGKVFGTLIYKNYIGSTSIPLIRTQCLRDINGFDEQMQSAQDYDVWLRIAQKNEIDYVEEPLVIYHEHDGEQITNNPQKKVKGLERINQKNKMYLDSDPVLWYKRNIIISPYYALCGDTKKALHIWCSCVRKCPLMITENLKGLRVIIRGKKKIKT